MVSKGAVKKGLDFKSLQAKGTVQAQPKTEKLPKVIAKELETVKALKPSEVKSKKSQAAVKMTVNTEIVKRAVLKDLKSKVKRFSPRLATPKSPKK